MGFNSAFKGLKQKVNSMSEIYGYDKIYSTARLLLKSYRWKCVLSNITYVSGSETTTEDFEALTSRGYILHQEKENVGWFSCVRDSISIFGGGKLWLVGVRKTSNSYVLLQLQLLRVWDEKGLRGVCLVDQEKGGHCLHVTSWDHVQPQFNAPALSSIRLWVRRQMKGLIEKKKRKGMGWLLNMHRM